ncbi:MAG: long-chain fatty acid--CoA ligase [Candidatus Dormibacteraeota bacterium]|nr:long-chain fatty acid--CoA ligase [Candidatus Dormibacteraeota bacterium]
MASQTVPDATGSGRAASPATQRVTLVDQFRRQVRERPTAPSLYFRSGDRYASISWAEFGQAARRWSSFLVDEGVEAQEHVAIWAGNRPEWHIADIGILSLRARPVPVYLTLSAEQGGYVLRHSESRVVVVENAALRDRVLEVRATLPALRRIVVMEGQERPSSDGFVISWQDALARGDEIMNKHRRQLDERAAAVTLDDVATLIYTSGTTGPPKAVLLTHGNVASAVDALDEFASADSETRVVSHLPLAHIAERLSTEFRSYVYGHPVYFVDSVANLGARLHEVRPMMFFTVPRVWEKMAQQVQKGVAELPAPRRALARWAMHRGAAAAESGGDARGTGLAERLVLGKLRALLGLDRATILASGAAPIAVDVLKFFRGIGLEVLEVYGQTEDTGLTSMNRPGRQRIGTVGEVLRGNEVRIAEDGEILVRGGTVFAGYYKDDEATGETLVDGWLHTGDVGELQDGVLRITDRKKDLIITAGGKNISPSNIEGELQQITLVGHAVAIGDRRPFVSALLTLDPEEAAEYSREHHLPEDLEQLALTDEVQSAIKREVDTVNARLSQVEQVKRWTLLPRDFEVGDELTPTLKVKRKVVAEKYADQIEALYAKS